MHVVVVRHVGHVVGGYAHHAVVGERMVVIVAVVVNRTGHTLIRAAVGQLAAVVALVSPAVGQFRAGSRRGTVISLVSATVVEFGGWC